MACSNDLSNLFRFILFFSITLSINAYKEIKAYRLIQYETEGNSYGSQYSTLNYIGAYYKADTLRKLSLVPINELENLEQVEVATKSQANALLFIIPKVANKLQLDLINKMQVYLAQQNLFIPVYFTQETQEISEILTQLKEEFEASEYYTENKGIIGYLNLDQNHLHFSISISEPKKVEDLQLENFFGFLEGQNRGYPNPTIAIITYYDSFSVSPDMPVGINTNGSGVIAMLELIRILSKFYENYENVLKFDILFVLTSAGNLNFEGTHFLVNNLENSVVENIQYALCLDSLGDINDDLFLHLSRFPREYEDNPNRLYKIFNSTVENMNFTLNYAKKKVFLSSKIVPWEHEQFSRKKILSATLSGLNEPVSSNFNRTTLLDNELNMGNLKRNIKFLSESLLAFLFNYDIKNFTIFKDYENLLDENNLGSLTDYLRKISRFPLNVQKNSVFNNDLYNIFSSYLKKTQRQPFEYKNMEFYNSNSGTIKVYNVKSKLIDLYLLIAILIYLLAIYIYTKGIKQFLHLLRSLFAVESD